MNHRYRDKKVVGFVRFFDGTATDKTNADIVVGRS
jgi:hypothetical protein